MHRKIIFMIILYIHCPLFADEINFPTHQIHFFGQEHFNQATLEDELGVDNKSFFQFWKDDNPLINDKLLLTLEPSLHSFYDSEGFYDANFTIKETNTTVSVHISENKPVRINDINISSDFDITPFITFQKNDIFKAKTFIKIKSKIITQLLKVGYCSYDFTTKAYVDLDNHSVDLKYKLKKGGVCTFGKVTIDGAETIDDDIIKSRVRAKEGERFSTELIKDTSDALYGLQSFDSVLIGVDRKFYNVVPVDITVKEMDKPYRFEVGVGYDTYVGPRVHSSIVKHNFLGNAKELKLQLAWSKLEQLAILNYFKPVLFDPYGFTIDFGSSLGYSNLEFDGFKEKKTFLKAYLEHTSKRFIVRSGIALEVIDVTELDDGKPKLPSEAYDLFLLTYPYVNVVYDGRDSKLNPKYGYYLRGYGEWGIPTDKESSLYLKVELEARGIYTFYDLTLSVVGKMGLIKIEGDKTYGIPESKKFFAGGSFWNRAYGFREIGVVTSPTTDLIDGGLTMANLSLEANYPVWDDLYGAVFTDNTLIAKESNDFTGDIITSAGIGVRYMTPIGPFKLDVGFNVNDPSIYGISFQIGQSF
ncbi:MAG: outer membrane protein assembly factor [Sulfurovum sp.]|nr:MAG: outer membrane protein assembly factor [Sulfurovum sp.]